VNLPPATSPGRVYLHIDGAYAGEMVRVSGTPENGTYSYSTYLDGIGYHTAVFYCDLSGPRPNGASPSDSLYYIPTEVMPPFGRPLVTISGPDFGGRNSNSKGFE